MTDRSLEAWKSWKQAQLKYDYFVVALTTTLFAYIGTKYIPEKLSFSQNSFELLALMILVVSIIAGIKRLEIDLTLQSIDVRKHEAIETRNVGAKILNTPGKVVALETGETHDPIKVQEGITVINTFIDKAKKQFEIEVESNNNMLKIRNYTLILGFVVLTISKFVGVYGAYANA